MSSDLNFFIGEYSFEGLSLVKNVYIKMDLFLNKTFEKSFTKSIYKNATKSVLKRPYYETINLISYTHRLPIFDECMIMIRFASLNYIFNLVDENQVEDFFNKCTSLISKN
jgi:hypothetical protein